MVEAAAIAALDLRRLGRLACLSPSPILSRDRQVRIERIGLEHHGDAARGRRPDIDVLAFDQDVASARLLEPGDDPEQGRLPAARRADEDHEFAVAYGEVDPMQHLGRAKRLHHRFQLKRAQFLSFRRFHHRPVRRRRALLSATPLLFIHGSLEFDGALFDRSGGDAADQLAREDEVENEHRQDRQRQRGQHRVPVGRELADEICAPSVTVLVASPGARISGNQRSFQIGIMVNTATVASAGRTSGKHQRKKILYSESPSMRAGVLEVVATPAA